jgi:hypothetical protein
MLVTAVVAVEADTLASSADGVAARSLCRRRFGGLELGPAEEFELGFALLLLPLLPLLPKFNFFFDLLLPGKDDLMLSLKSSFLYLAYYGAPKKKENEQLKRWGGGVGGIISMRARVLVSKRPYA